jgi:hypothetical protein
LAHNQASLHRHYEFDAGFRLDSHWPFVKKYGMGGLAFQSLALSMSSPAPGVVMWAPSDYEVREAAMQNGLYMTVANSHLLSCYGQNFGTRVDINLSPYCRIGEPNKIELWSMVTEPRAQGQSQAPEADMSINAARIGFDGDDNGASGEQLNRKNIKSR